ncbi:MAG: ATP phosphoribosyltransferase [Parasporobacterium sp.]|nr:ATP phosphoribosyltransferase [Parasporobacterium sp.]
MIIDDSVLQEDEKIIFTLRKLYGSYGYLPFRMSKFEEYDLYARNKDFLVSDNVITFTDTNGKLLALKPDVTLSIIKSSSDDAEIVQKVYYNENVYRVSKGNGSFSEIMQTGLECFGNVKEEQLCEVIELAVKSLETLSESAVLEISNLDLVEDVIHSLNLTREGEERAWTILSEKNPDGLDSLCEQEGADPEALKVLKHLLKMSGRIKKVLPELCGIFPENSGFLTILKKLAASDHADRIAIDFSITGDINYYNGIVFNGLIEGAPIKVLSGGQYDRIMQKLGRKSKAIGFAVYLDALELINDKSLLQDSADDEKQILNVALPKGRLGEKVYALFAEAGFECPELLEPNRKLIFENKKAGVRYFWVKPSDVAIYVERGAADVGVCGKDIIEEYEPEVYELLDMKMGKCRMAVAGPAVFQDNTEKSLRVATKFSNIARNYYQSKGREIDIIHLNGSIEIAPILGLSDVIVDIVETGSTLKENNLCVLEEILPISARLIANRASYQFKGGRIRELTKKLAEIV